MSVKPCTAKHKQAKHKQTCFSKLPGLCATIFATNTQTHRHAEITWSIACLLQRCRSNMHGSLRRRRDNDVAGKSDSVWDPCIYQLEKHVAGQRRRGKVVFRSSRWCVRSRFCCFCTHAFQSGVWQSLTRRMCKRHNLQLSCL